MVVGAQVQRHRASLASSLAYECRCKEGHAAVCGVARAGAWDHNTQLGLASAPRRTVATPLNTSLYLATHFAIIVTDTDSSDQV